MRAKLTPRREAFCQHYVVTLNATEAYKKAGYTVKYDNVAAAGGSMLLRNSNVAERIAELQAERDKSLPKSLGLTRRWVLDRLKKEAEREGEGSSQAARIRAAELIGKHRGMFKDRSLIDPDADATEGVTVNVFNIIRETAARIREEIVAGSDVLGDPRSEPVVPPEVGQRAKEELEAEGCASTG